MIRVSTPWTTTGYPDHSLTMLDSHAEIFEMADIHSEREYSSWAIWDASHNLWARGTAATTDEAKRVVESLVGGRWNARAASAT